MPKYDRNKVTDVATSKSWYKKWNNPGLRDKQDNWSKRVTILATRSRGRPYLRWEDEIKIAAETHKTEATGERKAFAERHTELRDN